MSPIIGSHFTLRTFITYAITIIVLSTFIVYVSFQARFLLAGPQISLQSAHGVSKERQIFIEGTARNIINITLNGRPIYTDSDGNFKEALVLENGYTIATLQAQDRYGRRTSHTETFVFAPEITVEEAIIN
jgi:hypothetical protein